VISCLVEPVMKAPSRKMAFSFGCFLRCDRSPGRLSKVINSVDLTQRFPRGRERFSFQLLLPLFLFAR